MAATAALMAAVDEGVLERILVGGVLRPDDQTGRGGLTARDPGGELLGRARVILRHGGGPQQVGQVPGMRHVALDRGDDRGRLACRSGINGQQRSARGHGGGQHQRGRRGQPPTPATRRAAAGPSTSPGQARPGQRDEEGHERGAANRHPADRGRGRLAHHQPAPREALPRPAAADRLAGDPPAGHRHRPRAQPQQQPLAADQHREDHGGRDRERDVRVPGDVD